MKSNPDPKERKQWTCGFIDVLFEHSRRKKCGEEQTGFDWRYTRNIQDEDAQWRRRHLELKQEKVFNCYFELFYGLRCID